MSNDLGTGRILPNGNIELRFQLERQPMTIHLTPAMLDEGGQIASHALLDPPDKVSEDRIKKLHPKVRDEVMGLLQRCNANLLGRAKVRITQGLRTFAEQNALYSQGRTKPGARVTNARAGQSFHNYGLAVDFCLLIDGKSVSWDMKKDFDGDKVPDWMEVVNIFRAAGWSWGGTWRTPDYPHFEKTFGKTWQQLKALHDSGKVDKDGFVII